MKIFEGDYLINFGNEEIDAFIDGGVTLVITCTAPGMRDPFLPLTTRPDLYSIEATGETLCGLSCVASFEQYGVL